MLSRYLRTAQPSHDPDREIGPTSRSRRLQWRQRWRDLGISNCSVNYRGSGEVPGVLF